VGYEWIAPASGYYSVNTVGSSFDTVLAVLQPACAGPELACNDDSGGSPQSEVVQNFTQGQRVLVAIDGKSGTSGTALLNIVPVTCPDTDLTGQPFPVTFTTQGGTNVHSGTCGGDGASERSYRWTPAAAGLYRFSVNSNAFQPALYLERGAKCGGEMLGCNATGGGSNVATVTRWLPAGEPVTIIVDSVAGTGAFQLNVETLSAPCPAATTFPSGNVVLDTSAPDIMSATCQPASSALFSGPTHEHTYSYAVNITTVGLRCGVRIDSDVSPVTAYVLGGSRCDGPEKPGYCSVSTCTGTACTLSFSFTSVDNGQYVLVVESAANFGSSLTYRIAEFCVL
jgi:hypothetical protein